MAKITIQRAYILWQRKSFSNFSKGKKPQYFSHSSWFMANVGMATMNCSHLHQSTCRIQIFFDWMSQAPFVFLLPFLRNVCAIPFVHEFIFLLGSNWRDPFYHSNEEMRHATLLFVRVTNFQNEKHQN